MAKKRSVRPDGEAVRQARLAKGWRVEDLARQADCSVKTVENAERGESVYANTLASMAQALKVGYKSLLATTEAVAPTGGTLRTKASIIIAANPDDPPPVERVMAELTERVPFRDEVAVGTSRAGCFLTAPDGGLRINVTLTCRDARQLADALRAGGLGTLDVRCFSAPDCWIWVFVAPPVVPD